MFHVFFHLIRHGPYNPQLCWATSIYVKSPKPYIISRDHCAEHFAEHFATCLVWFRVKGLGGYMGGVYIYTHMAYMGFMFIHI